MLQQMMPRNRSGDEKHSGAFSFTKCFPFGEVTWLVVNSVQTITSSARSSLHPLAMSLLEVVVFFLQTSKRCNAQWSTTRRINNICFVWISSPWDNVPGTLKGSFAQAECIRKMSLIESSPWREQSDVKIHSGLVE